MQETDKDIFEKDAKDYLPVFNRYKIVLDHGEGAYLWDNNGSDGAYPNAGVFVDSLNGAGSITRTQDAVGTITVGAIDPIAEDYGLQDIGFDGIGIDDIAEDAGYIGEADIRWDYATGVSPSASRCTPSMKITVWALATTKARSTSA